MRGVRNAVAALAAAAFLPVACADEPPPTVSYDLILDAQGVVFAGDDGSYARFPFATGRSEVEQAAGVVYGAGAALRSGSRACDAGPLAFTSYGPIQLVFQREWLVGWTIRRSGERPAEGHIAPGITRAELERLTAIQMAADPSQPGEFAYRTPSGPIYGVLAGEGPQSTVEALFAGTTCRLKR